MVVTIDPLKSRAFLNAFDGIQRIIERSWIDPYGPLTPGDRQALGEAIYFLRRLERERGLEEPEKAFAEAWFKAAEHVLARELEIANILTLGYYGKNYENDPHPAFKSALSVLVSVRALEFDGERLERDQTLWTLFEENATKLVKAISRLFNNRVDDGAPAFLLLNLIETLHVINCTESLEKLRDEVVGLARSNASHLSTLSAKSPGLAAYLDDLNQRLQLNVKLEGPRPTYSSKTSTFVALSELSQGKTLDPASITKAGVRSPTHLKWIAAAWNTRNQGDTTTGLMPFYERMDVDAAFEVVWGNSAEIAQTEVSPEDVKKVAELDDGEIKQLLHDYFAAHPALTATSRAGLSQELKKGHGGGEIADFNVEILLNGDDLWVSLPIKSGKELGSKPVAKANDYYFSQFVRPFLRLTVERTVVFPLVLARRTLDSTENLSSINANLRVPILVIDALTFTRIMRHHKLI